MATSSNAVCELPGEGVFRPRGPPLIVRNVAVRHVCAVPDELGVLPRLLIQVKPPFRHREARQVLLRHRELVVRLNPVAECGRCGGGIGEAFRAVEGVVASEERDEEGRVDVKGLEDGERGRGGVEE